MTDGEARTIGVENSLIFTQKIVIKLQCLIRYLHGSINMSRIIKTDNLSCMKTWVDASYTNHNDTRSHTGGIIGFDGLCVVTMKSMKQKLNSKSSTESEIIGVSGFLSWMLWTVMFLRAQGYGTKTSIFYQDNQSAIEIKKKN